MVSFMLNSPKIEKTEFYAGKFVKLPPIMKGKHGRMEIVFRRDFLAFLTRKRLNSFDLGLILLFFNKNYSNVQ